VISKNFVLKNMISNLYIVANTRCNLRCKYCYYDNAERSSDENLDYVKLEQFIDGKVERVSITGGEPLINPFLAEYLRIFKNKAKKIVLSTNGFLISDSSIKFLKENKVYKVFISLDANDKKIHNKQRPGSWDKATGAILKLQKMASRYMYHV
jgi:MoaA/NifB/PqqE/SkfB family radical SAM enzyme